MVRQKLTELGVPWVAMPVAAYREDRDELEAATGTREIPVVVLGDGTVLGGDTRDILEALDARFETPAEGARHLDQARAHRTLVGG
jgi:glutathione S-transferase